MTNMGWHYSKGDGKTVGPISREELRDSIASGMLTKSDLVWHQSLEKWASIGSVPSLMDGIEVASAPPPVPPPIHFSKQPQSSIDEFLDRTRERIGAIGEKVLAPASNETKTDTWGTVGSIAGAISGGLLFVGLCFGPLACIAVPVSIGGITSALFSDNRQLRKTCLIGNSIVLCLSLALVVWMAINMAIAINRLERLR